MDDISSKVAKRAQESQIAARVAKKVLAKGIPMGNTYQNPRVRIHRYRDQIRVTDLENAGKRGKKVREMVVGPTYFYKGDHDQWLEDFSHQALVSARSAKPYDDLKKHVEDLSKGNPKEVSLNEVSYRGVDVEPYGEVFEFKVPLDDGKSSLSIKSSPTDFRVTSHHWFTREDRDGFFQDTSYYPVKKKDAAAFYGWMKDNASKLKSLKGINDLRDIWKSQGIQYDYH